MAAHKTKLNNFQPRK